MVKMKRSEDNCDLDRKKFKLIIEKYGSEKVEKVQKLVKGQPTSSIKTAERKLYDQPVNKQASEEFSYKK